MTEKLYLEDLAVGQVFRAGPVTLSVEDIQRFAREYDPQIFHTNPDAAKESLFGGLVASGWHTAALTMRLIVESTPFVGGVVGRGGELSWPRPVRPGDMLRIEARITNIFAPRAGSERGLVLTDTITFNQNDEPVQKLSAKLFVSARGGPA
ncbi:MAG TPA: MaoC/PaaZ C-terminal domain-containing protein [Methylocystis sp.]|nr:MaoC/PaaZ C-terminal domain-containing protein [Methylocystis sp.]